MDNQMCVYLCYISTHTYDCVKNPYNFSIGSYVFIVGNQLWTAAGDFDGC